MDSYLLNYLEIYLGFDEDGPVFRLNNSFHCYNKTEITNFYVTQ
jgi:hypothetical protein